MNFLRTVHQIYSRYMKRSTTRILRCDPASISFSQSSDEPNISSHDTRDALNTAAKCLLHSHQPVAFPTETVYGLGAVALNESAVSKVFSTKGRPADNPLIVHISSYSMLRTLLLEDYNIPRSYDVLMKNFWPGPLTLLFPKRENVIPTIVTANQPTVAIRMPSHPVARALIAIVGHPLAAPSANSSGKPSPTRAEHVFKDLNGKLDIIIDGGACGVGLESTVIDGLHEDGNIRVLRPGGVTVEDIDRVLRKDMNGAHFVPRVLVHRRDYVDTAVENAPTTPGMKYRHYSPTAPVTLLCTKTEPSNPRVVPIDTYLKSLRDYLLPSPKYPMRVGVLAPEDSELWDFLHQHQDIGLEWHRYPLGPKATPSATAHRLFDGLITLDEQGVDHILIEEVDEEREGLAVMNRVRKAANEIQWITFGPPTPNGSVALDI